jgi:lipopolysaccharide transport system permease protein
MAVFTLAFQKIGDVETGGLPYPVFALAGVTFWTMFARSLNQGAESLVTNAHLLTKSAAPRLLIPLSPITSALFDLGIGLAFFLVFAGLYGALASWELLLVPAAVAFGVLFLLGPVLIFSALNVRYRDVRHILPFLVQIWLFLTPIAYPISALGEPWSTIVALNPLVGIVELFRWTLTGVDPPGAFELAASGAITVVVLVSALAYFARTERTLADVA